MRKIWIIVSLSLVVVIATVGYFGYRAIKDTLTIPKELEPYGSRSAALALIRSKAPAPGPDARLTEQQMEMFVGMLDSINIGADRMQPALADLHLDTIKNRKSKPNIFAVPGVVHQALMIAPLTRRAIVNSLNRNGLSWEQYLWIKERVLAASGITAAEADSSYDVNAPLASGGLKSTLRELDDSLRARARRDDHGHPREVPDELRNRGAQKSAARNAERDTSDNFVDDADVTGGYDTLAAANAFLYVDQLHASITVDPAEAALVAPYRSLLLRRGLACMKGRDEEF